MRKNRCHDRQTFEAGQRIVRQFPATFLWSGLTISAALCFSTTLGVMALLCLANEHAAAQTFEHSGGNMSNTQTMLDDSTQMSKIYGFKAKTIDGEEIDFSKYKGSVMLIGDFLRCCVLA